ncbi:MAG: hypothetical protein QGH74_08665 [Candidatus Brocadiia bacterium]|jgi:hypothetical protein|nr:hypothetical protein [Candidatus Brocadiia bacterium]
MLRTDIMDRARDRAAVLGVRNVVVATNTGSSVLAAKKAFGQAYEFFAVGNPAASHDRGLCLHDGISESKRAELEKAGIRVILHDQTLFQGQPKCEAAMDQHGAVERAYARRFHRGDELPPGSADLVGIMFNVLNEFFGDGPRVCLEITLAAADSGQLPLDADCIAIATPASYCDLPDAAMVLRPVKSQDMFSTQFRVKDLLLCPTPNDVWFSNRELP